MAALNSKSGDKFTAGNETKCTHLSWWDLSILDHLYEGLQLVLQFSELQTSHSK